MLYICTCKYTYVYRLCTIEHKILVRVNIDKSFTNVVCSINLTYLCCYYYEMPLVIEAYNLEGAKGAYCQVCSIYIYFISLGTLVPNSRD